jgi:hypothetical protein
LDFVDGFKSQCETTASLLSRLLEATEGEAALAEQTMRTATEAVYTSAKQHSHFDQQMTFYVGLFVDRQIATFTINPHFTGEPEA